jgi:hypothetical protein
LLRIEKIIDAIINPIKCGVFIAQALQCSCAINKTLILGSRGNGDSLAATSAFERILCVTRNDVSRTCGLRRESE